MAAMRALTAIALGLFLSMMASAEASRVTPIQKVIQMLTGMVEKGKKEKNEEMTQFAAYKQFCDDTTTEKTRSIAEANERMEKLTADIGKFNEEAAKLTKEIAKHEGDIATWAGDMKATTGVREIENSEYQTLNKDYTDSVRALKEAIKTIGSTQGPVQGQAAMIQLAAGTLIPDDTKLAIHNYLDQGMGDLGENLALIAAPAAYEGQSGQLIDMLEKLVTKFEDEQTEVQKKEKEARQAYELMAQDLKAYMDTSMKAKIDKTETKAKDLQMSADASSELQDTTNTRDDDSKYLADLTATCQEKSASFEARQKLRAEEIEAVEKAIEIFSSPDVAGAGEKHLPSLMQASVESLAQLRSVERNPQQLQVAAYLNDQGRRINSRILQALAVRMTEDPFKKVVKMIKDLIVKLMEEANGESEHKAFCDEELSANEQSRKSKTEAVETLHAEIDLLEAEISKATSEIGKLSQDVVDLDAAVAKATAERESEKEKNTATIADAKSAQVAVASALKVLNDFYAKAGQATSFLQEPEIFDEPYKGMGGENGGVVGMIEVIASDFARLESETSAGEEAAKEEYKQFMADSATDKQQKQTDIDNLTDKKDGDGRTLEEKRSDLLGTQKELSAGLEYYEKMKPQCIEQGVSFEDRVARRKEEIDSLKQALAILEGEQVA